MRGGAPGRGRRSGRCVQRVQRLTQPTVYIFVHLDMSVGSEVVGVGQPAEHPVHAVVPGGRADDSQRRRGVFRTARAVLTVLAPGLRPGGLRHRVTHAQTLPRSAAVRSITMATTEECRSALDRLSDNMTEANSQVRSAAALDRSLSCHITDLDVTFTGRLVDGRIQVLDTVAGPPPAKAEIRLAMKGDDLVALVAGELNFAKAWGSGRVRLEAGFRDLLRLRTLL